MKTKRCTRQRQLVLAAVRSRMDHPTAEQIFEDVRSLDDRISRGTVYRNLGLLSENGEINRIRVTGADRFDHMVRHHHHLLCVRCGRVLDSPIEYETENDHIVAGKTGFRVDRHQTVYEGVCPECLGGDTSAEADGQV